MKPNRILRVEVQDRRFPLEHGAGTDAVHRVGAYALAVTRLILEQGPPGSGIALTLGVGNDIVCRAIAALAVPLAGREIEEMMAGFGALSQQQADHPELRWLGPTRE